jgi:hypothetical protein
MRAPDPNDPDETSQGITSEGQGASGVGAPTGSGAGGAAGGNTGPAASPSSGLGENTSSPAGPGGTGTGGVSSSTGTPSAGPGIGEGEGSGGGGGGGAGCVIASWAMNGLRVPEQDQRREFFEAFYRYWLRKYPKSGKRQVRKYQLIARRLIERIARRGPTEVRAAQQLIFERVIAPTGATLEPNEFEGAYQRLRAVMEDLVQRHGLELDPADIPHPADEIMATMRERRRREAAA